MVNYSKTTQNQNINTDMKVQKVLHGWSKISSVKHELTTSFSVTELLRRGSETIWSKEPRQDQLQVPDFPPHSFDAEPSDFTEDLSLININKSLEEG